MTGLWFSFAHFAFGLSWVLYALTFFDGKLTYLMPFAFIGAGLIGIVFMGLPILFTSYFDRRYRPFAMAGLIVVFEWLRSFVATGFPWNLTGTIFTYSPEMIQAAAYIGTYGLSLIALIAFFLPAIRLRYLFISALMCAGLYLFGVHRLVHTPVDTVPNLYIRIVQPNISPDDKHRHGSIENQLEHLVSLSRRRSARPFDYVIWPETAVTTSLERRDDLRNILMRAVQKGGYLITGTLRIVKDPFQVYNSVLVLNDLGETIDYYDKSHLVPFGEYVPFRQYLPVERIVPGLADFSAGVGRHSMDLPKGPSVGMLVCYEIIFPTEVVYSAFRPGYLINVTNDGWYKGSAGPYQHLAATQMRAVEEGLPIIRAANTGISAAIDPMGRIYASLPLLSEGVIDTEIAKALPPTVYARYGNLIPLMLCLFILSMTAFLSYADRRR